MTSFQRVAFLLRWPSFPRKHVLVEAGTGIHLGQRIPKPVVALGRLPGNLDA